MVLFRYCLNSQTNSYLSKRRARLLIENFLRYSEIYCSRSANKKKMIIKEEPIYWRRILSPKTVIFLLRGLIPKFWDRYQRLQDQRISFNNFFKNPTQSFLLRVFELVAYVLEKLVGKDPKGENEEISPLIESLMDTVFLLSMANGDINEYRRNNIKSDLRTYA